MMCVGFHYLYCSKYIEASYDFKVLGCQWVGGVENIIGMKVDD